MTRSKEVIRQGCLEKLYYCDSQGRSDKLMEALDCWEQMLMYALTDYNIEGKKIFCDDVTPFLAMNDVSWVLRKNYGAGYRHLFDIIDLDIQYDPIKVIEDLVKQNKIVSVSTIFDLIPNYAWYDPGSKGIYHSHFCMVVGYNEDEYYIVDSSSVFEPLRDTIHSQNPTIHIVQKKDLIRPFELHCDVSIINIKYSEQELLEYNPYKQIIKQSIESFYFTGTIQEEGQTVYKGKQALIHFKELVMNHFEHILLQEYLKSHFDVHILLSRHIILKWNLLLNKHSFKANTELFESLDLCIKYWNQFKMVMVKNTIKKDMNYRQKILDAINLVMKYEEIFVHNLEDIKF